MKKLLFIIGMGMIFSGCGLLGASEDLGGYEESYDDIFSPSAEEYIFDSTDLTARDLDTILDSLTREPSPRRSQRIATMNLEGLIEDLETMDPTKADQALEKMSQHQELYSRVLDQFDDTSQEVSQEPYYTYSILAQREKSAAEKQKEQKFQELIKKHKEKVKKKISPRLKKALLAVHQLGYKKKGEKRLSIGNDVSEKALSLLGEQETVVKESKKARSKTLGTFSGKRSPRLRKNGSPRKAEKRISPKPSRKIEQILGEESFEEYKVPLGKRIKTAFETRSGRTSPKRSPRESTHE